MPLQSLNPVVHGAFDALPALLAELQGLTFSVVTGATANTTIPLAAIRDEDTLVAVLEFAAGVPTDRKGATTINSLKATGTLTCASVLANDTVQVNGVTLTFKAAGTADPNLPQVNLGANDTETAANLAAKLNLVGQNVYRATSAAGVVTVTALADGTAGNSITTVGGPRITASGGVLAGGAATGGIKISAATTGNQVLVVWFNKR